MEMFIVKLKMQNSPGNEAFIMPSGLSSGGVARATGNVINGRMLTKNVTGRGEGVGRLELDGCQASGY